ncbi:hypothetical protein HZS_5697 [Henneguya salminicola]|nr:hypothetical protein HZS_5697 [Henneguya salminicola]
MELLNKFFAINSKNLDEKQSNPRAYAPEMKYYIIDTDLQSKFNFRELDEIQKEKKIKYTQLRHAIVYNLTPILESFLNTGLSSVVSFIASNLRKRNEILAMLNGDSIINDPILSLLDTYGPSIIKDNGNFGDREHMLFIISKIKSTKGLAEGELFANFVLEGVLRGKLATWIHTICLDWVDIIFYYGDNSFMRCSEIHEIVASLSKLEDININSCF